MIDSFTTNFEAARQNGHLAVVRMRLLLDQSSLGISQLGPDFLILRDPATHPPSIADIILSVDGKEERWTVRLPEGIRPDHIRVPISVF